MHSSFYKPRASHACVSVESIESTAGKKPWPLRVALEKAVAGRGLWVGLLCLLALMLCHCRWHATEAESDAAAETESLNAGALRLQVHSASLDGALMASLAADSLVVQVTGEGVAPLSLVFAGGQNVLVLSGLPAGERRVIEVAAYARGRKLYAGHIETVIDPLRKQPVDVVLRPCFGRVRAQVLLSSLEPGIASGQMVLRSGEAEYVGVWNRKGAVGYWVADTLPEAGDYQVRFELRNTAGEVMYVAERSGVAVSAGKEASVEITLLPTQVKPTLNVTLLPAAETGLHLRAPAFLRAPLASGELQITELYPIPTSADSASEGEWLEIMNASGDSLRLAGCRISRELSTTDTRSLGLDSIGVLAPGAVITLGRRASGAQYPAGGFSLVNTTATLWLTCRGDSSVQDTVRYDGSGASAGAVALREGQVAQRRPSSLGTVARPEDFCVSPARAGIGSIAASPGKVFPGCGED
jgi:hypothetical protein